MINFDIISSDTSQDARAAVRGFRILREQQFFRDVEDHVFIQGEEKHYFVWADCGTHFRNKWIIGYLLTELAELNINGINLLI